MQLKHLLALCAAAVGFGAGSFAFAADAQVQEQAKQALARDAVCTVCHNENWRVPVLSLYQTRHGNRADPRAPNCQSCHGESSAHQKDPGGVHPDVVFADESKHLSSADDRNAACLSCHESRILPRTHWTGSQHQTRGVACSNCHDIHAPTQRVLNKVTQPEVCFACHKTQRAQTHRISTHPILAGKVACSDCHNPHGSTGPTLLVKNSVNETCYTCHAEKRGPFLWEHAPVVDDCTNCHTPHGSNMWALLKTRPPMLCQNCHSGDHGKNLYSGANLPNGNVTTVNGQLPLASRAPPAQENSRGCVSCHSLIHGSNHPAGAKFQR